VLKCLDRSWQPKVIAILESRGLSTMTTTALFGKLREPKIEMHGLNEQNLSEKR